MRTSTGEGLLAFEDEEGKLDLVEASEVAQVLQDSGVHLVLLDACQSAMSSDEALSSASIDVCVNAQLGYGSRDIILHDAGGHEVARSSLAIPCSGSRLWRYHTVFDAPTRALAGAGAYVIIRDATCRIFGYHGLLGRDGAFSLDHMFGF